MSEKNKEFDQKVEISIPSEVHLIICSNSRQTTTTYEYELPETQGMEGGRCTAALLQTLHEANNNGSLPSLSWKSMLKGMRNFLEKKGSDEVPQVTSSRMTDVTKPIQFVNETGTGGTKRALLIGVHYAGKPGQLSSCHSDVLNMKEHLINVHGFKSEDVIVLLDDVKYHKPDRSNIMYAFSTLVKNSVSGDTVFIHYSGHGGRVKDNSGDNINLIPGGRVKDNSGDNVNLIPVDYQSSGQIIEEDLYRYLVKPMSRGVLMTCFMDCCHGGSVFDLPYRLIGNGTRMKRVENFDFFKLNTRKGDNDCSCCLACAQCFFLQCFMAC